jgi:hypothetical protein
MRLLVTLLIGGMALFCARTAMAADCIDVSKKAEMTLAGRLDFKVFPGPPEYENVRTGDAPEPTYILRLDEPVCAYGDENLDQNQKISDVHITVADGSERLWPTLAQLIGRQVHVTGNDVIGSITGHHHAPLVMWINDVGPDVDPTRAYGTAMTTVEGFYDALEVGSGEEAASFVVPAKRNTGPLSAAALTSFYRNLKTPLSLTDVQKVSDREYRALYVYETAQGKACNGSALVTTTDVDGENLISGITAENGC